MRITWKHEHTELIGADFDKKVEIFYEKIWGWTLHVAELTINGGRNHEDTEDASPVPHSGFAVLQILFSYFEMIGRYVEGNLGKDQSKEFFTKGLRYVFPQIDSFPYRPTKTFIDILYAGGRCGLYHMSMTGKGIAISGNPPSAIAYSPEGTEIIINPHRLPAELNLNLKKYCNDLRNPANNGLRDNFQKRFDRDNPKP